MERIDRSLQMNQICSKPENIFLAEAQSSQRKSQKIFRLKTKT